MTRRNVSGPFLLLAFLSVACGYDNGDRRRVDPEYVPETSYGTIDTGQTMTDLTTGTGLFVEYATGGNWTMQVSCDTATTQNPCYWDIFAITAAGNPVYSTKALGLESTDLVEYQSNGQVHLMTETLTDLDGVSFTTDPGAAVVFDIVLDDNATPAERYFYYVANGHLVQGVVTPIIQLTPTEP